MRKIRDSVVLLKWPLGWFLIPPQNPDVFWLKNVCRLRIQKKILHRFHGNDISLVKKH